MSSPVERLSPIDGTSSPSASISATYLPPAHEYPPPLYQSDSDSDSEQEDLEDPSSSFSRVYPRFEVIQPLDAMYPYKTLLTSISIKRERGAEIRFAYRASQLTRVRREKCAALLEYRLLRIHEINIMQTIAQYEHNEAVTLNEDVEYHQSYIHKLDAIRATAQEEYIEALALLRSADLEIGKSEGTIASLGEHVPPEFSETGSHPGSQTSSMNSGSRPASPDLHLDAV